eukprot:14476418-Ditylum_brightwellii.AAC.2
MVRSFSPWWKYNMLMDHRKNCKVISRTTVQDVTDSELKTDEIKALFVVLDKAVGLSDMLHEEDTKDKMDEGNERSDNLLPYDPNSLVGAIEEDATVFD